MNSGFFRVVQQPTVYSISPLLQTLSRQLAELKDSLQFSNKSCEQLESKAEELERTSTSFRKLCEHQQVQLEQKTAAIKDLEEKLDTVQKEYQKMKDNLELHQVQHTLSKSCIGSNCKLAQKKSTSFSGEDTVDHPTASQREHELLKTVEELTEKFRTASYQRQKYEKGLREVLTENQTLTRSLERVEADAAELQARLRAYEDAMEKQQSLERSGGSPKPQFISVSSTPTYGSVFQYNGLPSPGSEDIIQVSLKSSRTTESLLGTSLFSELDSQFSDLQERYDQLVQQCTCSAGLVHRSQLKLAAADGYSDNVLSSLVTQPETSPASAGTPFKDLFEEVFATLKQTAAVADKLVQRKKSSVM